ncbi:hypothetical protein SeMB42_g03645 [Synchytrium endobioticum]|uniref:sn-1-specific diacylglycerol lipase n=1 Tax=Synchytrium endobioticum TaxID=286115 RepID=A0A507D4Z1_9FUNG|nr:hypothetical protein SeMB42_g03645 [Synchytrium endobioticum]
MLSHESVRFVSHDEADHYETTTVDYDHDDIESTTTIDEYVDCYDQFVDEDGTVIAEDVGALIIPTSRELQSPSHSARTMTIVNPRPVPPLLNERIAKVISNVTIATRLALRLSQILIEAFFETLAYGTSSSLSFTRGALVAAISVAKCHKRITAGEQNSSFSLARVWDRYTTAGIYFVHNAFTLAELFSMSSFHLVSKTITLSLRSAEEAVRVIDGLFGSTETSRALAAFVWLVKNELDDWRHEMELTYPAPFGHMFALGSVTKGITAYSCLQYVSRKRQSIKAMKLTPVFEAVMPNVGAIKELGDVVVEESMSRQGASEVISVLEESVSRQSESDVMSALSSAASTSGSPKQDLLPVLQHPRGDSAVCLSVPHADEFDEELPVKWTPARGAYSSDEASLRSCSSSPRLSRWVSEALTPLHKRRRHRSLPKYETKDLLDSRSNHNHKHEPVVMIHEKTQAACLRIPTTPTWERSQSLWDFKDTAPNKVPSLLPSPPRKGGMASPIRSLRSSNSLHNLSITSLSSVNSGTSGYSTASTSVAPHRHLLAQLSRFLGFSCGAYGTHFVRILGLQRTVEELVESVDHHHNVQTFASLAGIPLECILTSSFTTPRAFTQPSIKALVHYVAVDPATKSIVLTLRGTLGLSDLLTDLTCEYHNYETAVGKGFVHAGMLRSARKIYESAVADVVAGALRQYPEFGLVLCGHSLGGGVAALLATMWANMTDDGEFVTNDNVAEGRPIHCYCYGPPSTMSAELSKAYKDLITCVVFRNDVIPCLSLGLIRDFKTVAVALAQERGTAEKVISRALHIFRGSVPSDWDSDPDDVWEWALLKTLRAGMSADKTFPPGTIYWISATPAVCGGAPLLMGSSSNNTSSDSLDEKSPRYLGKSVSHETMSSNPTQTSGSKNSNPSTSTKESKLTMHRCEDVEAAFSEAHFSTTMFADHAPSSYATALEALCTAARHQEDFDED